MLCEQKKRERKKWKNKIEKTRRRRNTCAYKYLWQNYSNIDECKLLGDCVYICMCLPTEEIEKEKKQTEEYTKYFAMTASKITR